GNREAAEKAYAESKRCDALLIKQMQLGPDFTQLVKVGDAELEIRMRLLQKDYAPALAEAAKQLADAKNWPQSAAWQKFREDLAHGLRVDAIESALRLNRDHDAEATGRALLEAM